LERVFDINEIRTRLEPVFVENRVKSAILFGSYAKGAATQKSDVDILVDSGCRGLSFMGLVETIREALEDKPVDIIDVVEVVKSSRLDDEIEKTGVRIYG